MNTESDAGRRPLYPFGHERKEIPYPLTLVILGVTGSIGRQTLDLVRRDPDRFRVGAVTCRARSGELKSILDDLAALYPDDPPPLVAIHDAVAREDLAGLPGLSGRVLAPGMEGLLAAVSGVAETAVVVNGLVGAVGLEPTLAAAGRGMRIALANKESLVVGGHLVAGAAEAGGAEVLPVDSEHAAIAQCLWGRAPEEVAGLLLTASGGPFRKTPAAELEGVSLDRVLDHPTWNMGPKITVDSATLMNKGLEVIEAHHLFGIPYERISVVVHPGSIVHSRVEFRDGSLLAQLGTPDMRVPLLYAISGERHLPLATERLDLVTTGTLRFEEPDLERFPCLSLAREAGKAGGELPIVLNGANEVAVESLLAERIGFADIPRVIAACLESFSPDPVPDLESALAVDARARARAAEIIGGLPGL